MSINVRRLHRTLCSTALCTLAALTFTPDFAHAFNPNEGAEPIASTPLTRSRLPSTAPLVSPMPKLTFPEYSAPRQVPAENQTSALPPIELTAPQPSPYPPVDAATAARASQIQAADDVAVQLPPMPAAVIAPAQPQAIIAPVPVLATAPMPEPLAAPNALTAPLPYVPEKLTDESKKILSHIPSKIDTTKNKGGKLAIKRMTPGLQEFSKEPKVETFDSAGLSIKVQRSGLDTNHELNRAYTALMGGDSVQAIEVYKNILTAEPNNQDALFGLAATYHRQGEIAQARPYYGKLLEVNPSHREGLNNFLALISEESPQEALAELERLEDRNPDFSPIPAQQAVLLNKLGFTQQASDKMLRAIELAPENLTYKYNLAVMLDQHGDYAFAGDLYQQLINASLRGEKIPAPAETLQKRLNFIATATAPAVTTGG